MDHLVLTVIAPDQPGLVERIAQCIAAHGGNWLESRMSRMAGQFAGILKVAVPAEGYDELVEGLQALNSQGIRVLVAESGIEPVCTWKPIHLDLVGNDRPGIVRDITRLLAGLEKDQAIRAAEALRNFEKPVLLAWGADDRYFKLELAHRLAAMIPAARVEPIARGRK